MQHKHNNFIQYSGAVGFAGSRHGTVKQSVCKALVSAFVEPGLHFLVGCAPGIDHCFRTALTASSVASQGTVHCAFPSRLSAVKQEGLYGVCLVADAPSSAAALHRRTVTMVSECSFLILFPDDPTTGSWGKGSQLAFHTAVQQHISVFVVTAIPPLNSQKYGVEKGSLFDIVSGYQVVSKEAVHVR